MVFTKWRELYQYSLYSKAKILINFISFLLLQEWQKNKCNVVKRRFLIYIFYLVLIILLLSLLFFLFIIKITKFSKHTTI